MSARMRSTFPLLLLLSLLGTLHTWGQTAGATRTVTCASNGARVQCPADGTYGVRLQRQLGKASCVESRTWGYDSQQIWVENGCKAAFSLGDPKHAYRRNNSPYGGVQTISCSSEDDGRQVCDADTRYGVSLTRQLSDRDCVLNQTWGYDKSHIWVSRGCRANFTLGH